MTKTEIWLLEKHKKMLSVCKEEIDNFRLSVNDFETEIMDSFEIWLNKDKPLTWKQFKVLNRIYERIE
jgi:hypothetical protein